MKRDVGSAVYSRAGPSRLPEGWFKLQPSQRFGEVEKQPYWQEFSLNRPRHTVSRSSAGSAEELGKSCWLRRKKAGRVV